jgi:acyl-[acyl-carrier-protein]-phospholipid O-acyltransferase/long-chain-fatty-acid--[acyl-carrier-protein] ligase
MPFFKSRKEFIMEQLEQGYVLDREYKAFQLRAELEGHLAGMAFKGLASAPLRKMVVDLSVGRKELRAGMILAVALTLAERWGTTLHEPRVGVVFPSGLGGTLTNLALALMDKVPVNLNFTAGRKTNQHCLEIADIRSVITARPVKDKVADFPWPERTIDLLAERVRLDKKAILRRLLRILLLPTPILLKQFKVPQVGGRREAAVLFSSGSTGEPKGIVLSHRNVIANCLQIHDCRVLHREHTLLASLPTFHSFGFTVTLWYPLITGMKCVTVPSPLETRKIAEAVQREKISVILGTPTFLRPYFKLARAEQLESLEYVVTGAEKTPPGFARRWEETFKSAYMEGYGLTETSPVTSCNIPAFGSHPAQAKAGSVGRLMDGMRARVTDPATGVVLPINQGGMIELQGPNIFEGYLNAPEATQAVFRDGWFVTGDLGRIDEEGYLFIEGRLSRFSKLGGEMVPHGRLEQVIARVFQLEDAESPLVAVTGITDEVKGEALVLLSAVDIKPAVLRERLMQEGIPNLWVPRTILRVDAIPSLASGKLDLQALNQLVAQRVQEEATER